VNATPIKEEILWEIDHLPLHSQKLVLDFARALRSTFLTKGFLAGSYFVLLELCRLEKEN